MPKHKTLRLTALWQPTVAGLAMVIIMIPVLVGGIIIVGFMLVVTYDYT